MLDTRSTSRPGGFTLLEIIIVIAILAILATVTVGYFQNVRRDAEFQQCQANIILINHAMDRFKANNQFFPTSLDEVINTDAYGLPVLPRCPSEPSPTTPAVTYGMKIPVAGQEGYQYLLYCTDERHKPDANPGFPQYDSLTNKFLEF